MLKAERGAVTATVLDNYHDMACIVRHDGSRVIAVDGEVRRAPFTTCPAAPEALDELVGLPLATGRTDLYGAGRAGRNCTHLFDIAVLAIGMAASGGAARRFDFIVPDETEPGAEIEARVDGAAVHCWTIVQGIIRAPEGIAGRPLFVGFARWAASHFRGVELDTALHLQKATFVARGRRVLLDRPIGDFALREPERFGACYTFSEPQLSIAGDAEGYVRDFTRGLPGDIVTDQLP